MEHSENKTIVRSGLFENEIGPGVLNSILKKTCALKKCQRQKAEDTENIFILSFFSGILAEKCLLNARLEHSRSNLVFDICYDFTF